MISLHSLDGVENLYRKGKAIVTYNGISFWPTDPRPEEINIEDIAHSLSMLCRFNGHVEEFYSVGDHSIRVSYACPPEYALYGLLHDASEAYLSDIPTPLKGSLPRYKEYERILQSMIYRKYGLEDEEPKEVKHADRVLLSTEIRDLCPKMNSEHTLCIPLSENIKPLSIRAAKESFLSRFSELTKDVCPSFS